MSTNYVALICISDESAACVDVTFWKLAQRHWGLSCKEDAPMTSHKREVVHVGVCVDKQKPCTLPCTIDLCTIHLPTEPMCLPFISHAYISYFTCHSCKYAAVCREKTLKSQQVFFWMKSSTFRDGTLKKKQNSQTRWEWHYNTFTPSLHLVPFCQLCVCCVHRRVMDGNGVGSAGCVVHVDVYGEWVVLWVAAT